VKSTFLTLALLLAAGRALVSADDLEDAYSNLQKAQEQKDAAQVKRLAAELHALANAIGSTPAPQSDDEKAAWTSRVAHAKELDLGSEYALYATAIQLPAAGMVDLISTLEQQNPKSKYLDAAYGPYLAAMVQTRSAAQARAVADKALAKFPDNEDLLLFVADGAMTNKQTDRALTCATRLISVLSKHPKPEGMSAAEWERQRSIRLGRGYWFAGVIHAERQVWAPADQELRSALPLIKGNDPLTAAALFYLGVANYQLGKLTLNKARVLEAGRFSEQAAAFTSPYAQQAWHNAQVSKTEAGRMR
jgi:tetratricopeptide (TPR) repeat protein